MRREAQEPAAGSENLRYSVKLVGHGSNHQVGPKSENLLGAGGPGISDNRAPADLGTNVQAIFRASHQPVESSQVAQCDGSARLQRNHASNGIPILHSSIPRADDAFSLHVLAEAIRTLRASA